LWVRNIQLSSISLVIAMSSVYTKDLDQASRDGFFTGYNYIVWTVIFLQGGGGLIVAVVVKYADNILKGFATSIATVLSTIASIWWFGFEVTPLFFSGAVLVLGSAYLYNLADIAATSAAASASAIAANLAKESLTPLDLEHESEDVARKS